MATLYLAKVKDYFWDDQGDAHVRMFIDIEAASRILGVKILSDEKILEVEGLASQGDESVMASPRA